MFNQKGGLNKLSFKGIFLTIKKNVITFCYEFGYLKYILIIFDSEFSKVILETVYIYCRLVLYKI